GSAPTFGCAADRPEGEESSDARLGSTADPVGSGPFNIIARHIMSPFGILLASQLVVTVADQVPSFHVRPACRAPVDIVGTSAESCLNDEKEARQQLAKEWSQFSARDREMCTDETKSYNPSYVELLTCLESARDAEAYGQSGTKK